MAVLAYAVYAHVNHGLGERLFEVLYNSRVPEDEKVRQVSSFIDRWGQHFMQYGHVEEVAHGGMPRKVPDAVAKEASTIVKRGYWAYSFTARDGHRHKTHHWFPDIQTAVAFVPELQNIIRQCDCTPKQLLAAMMANDPNLHFRCRHFKLALTDKQKANRQFTAQLLLALYLSDETVLTRAVWIDECKIRLSSMARGGFKVLCDAHDEEVDEVMECSWLGKGADVTLQIILAVNAQVGVLYCDFTTGTTDIIRHHLPQQITFKVRGTCKHYTICSALWKRWLPDMS